MTSFNENDIERAADGKFAPKTTSETDMSAISNEEAGVDWGEAKIQYGSRTRYGAVQYTDRIAEGITAFGTAGHGGIKLSPERQKRMGDLAVSGAVYEEDDEANLVIMRYPEAFATDESDAAETYARAAKRVADIFPDQYESHTGTTLRFGESSTKDEAEYARLNAGKRVVRAASLNGDGTTRVYTSIMGAKDKSDDRQYDIPSQEYTSGLTHYGAGTVPKTFEPAPHHKDVTPPPKPRYHSINADAVPKAQRERVAKDMSTIYNTRSGPRSLQRMIEEDGMVGKRTYTGRGGRRRFYLDTGEGMCKVTHATYLAVDAEESVY